jgi:hypothetical protein
VDVSNITVLLIAILDEDGTVSFRLLLFPVSFVVQALRDLQIPSRLRPPKQ